MNSTNMGSLAGFNVGSLDQLRAPILALETREFGVSKYKEAIQSELIYL